MESKIIWIAPLLALISFGAGLVAVIHSLRDSKEPERNNVPLAQLDDGRGNLLGEAGVSAQLPHVEDAQPRVNEPRTSSKALKISILAPISRSAGDSLKALSLVNGYKEY